MACNRRRRPMRHRVQTPVYPAQGLGKDEHQQPPEDPGGGWVRVSGPGAHSG